MRKGLLLSIAALVAAGPALAADPIRITSSRSASPSR
jgi:hypothetical protein